MSTRKHFSKNKRSVNELIYQDCLEIEDGNSKRAYKKYKKIMAKLKAKERLENEEEYTNLT